MADIAAFLRMDGSFQRVNISAGSTAGHVDKTGMRQKIQKRPDNAEYSVKYLRDQQEKLFQVFGQTMCFFFFFFGEIECHLRISPNQRHLPKSNRPKRTPAVSAKSIQMKRIPSIRNTISTTSSNRTFHCRYVVHKKRFWRKSQQIQWL